MLKCERILNFLLSFQIEKIYVFPFLLFSIIPNYLYASQRWTFELKKPENFWKIFSLGKFLPIDSLFFQARHRFILSTVFLLNPCKYQLIHNDDEANRRCGQKEKWNDIFDLFKTVNKNVVFFCWKCENRKIFPFTKKSFFLSWDFCGEKT